MIQEPLDQATLAQFPGTVYIKVVGHNAPGMELRVRAIVAGHVPAIEADAFCCRVSRGGHYLSVTCTVYAQSREQMDAIYQDLAKDPHFILAL